MFCELQGARLCSVFELENDEAKEGYEQPTCKTGTTDYDDFYDEISIWTSTPCTSRRYGVEGYFTRTGARQWATHTPPRCRAPNETAFHTKCCADSSMVMPIMGAQAPSPAYLGGGHGIFHTLPNEGPAAVAYDHLRKRLLVAGGPEL